MEESLDELTEVLVREIAGFGPAGVELNQLTTLLRTFYPNRHSKSRTEAHSSLQTNRNVDDNLLSQIWQRLGQHAETSIGEDHIHDATPLANLRALTGKGDLPNIYVARELATNEQDLESSTHTILDPKDDLVPDGAPSNGEEAPNESMSTRNAAGTRANSDQMPGTDDSDYKPRRSATRHNKQRQSRRSNAYLVDSEDEGRPQGRPRRFVRGTEKFWQRQFWQARLNNSPNGNLPISKVGTMWDPAGLRIFESRPTKFDETLVQAKTAGLPLPEGPEDISSSWVRQTKLVLRRRESGAYLTPKGMFLGRAHSRSQILVVKSDRLKEVDFSSNNEVPRFRFLTSSLAHSFSHPNARRFGSLKSKGPSSTGRQFDHVLAEKTPRHLFITSCVAHSRLYYRTENERARISVSQTPKRKKAHQKSAAEPRLGVFHENAATSPAVKTQMTMIPKPPLLTPSQYRELMDSTDSDSDVPLIHRKSRSSTSSRRGSRDSTVATVDSTFAHGQPVTESRTSGQKIVTTNAANTRPTRTRKPTRKMAETIESHDDDVEVLPKAKKSQLHRSQSPVQVIPLPVTKRRAVRDARVLEQRNNDDDTSDTDSRSTREDTVTSTSESTTKSRRASASGSARTASPETNSRRRQEPTARSTYQLGQLIRTIILELVEVAGGAAPGNQVTVREAMAPYLLAAGERGLPPLEKVRNIINNLWHVGRLQKIYFSYHAKDGTRQQKTIMAILHLDPDGTAVQNLKTEIQAADKANYVPPEWGSNTDADPNHPRTRSVLVFTERLMNLEVPEQPGQRPLKLSERETTLHASRIKSHGQRERRSSSASGSDRASLGSSRPKRKRRIPHHLRESVEPPEEASTASPSSRSKPLGHEGFLTLKVPAIGQLRQVQEFNATFRKSHRTALKPTTLHQTDTQASESNPATATRKGTTHISRRAKDRRFDPKTLQPIWEKADGFLLATCLQDILEAQASYDLKLRPRPHGNDLERAFDKVDIVWAWEERIEDEIDGIDHQWLLVNHSATVDPELISPISAWNLVSFDDEGQISEHEQTTFNSWLPFEVALKKAAESEPFLADHSPDRPLPRSKTAAKPRIFNKRKVDEVLADDDSDSDRDSDPAPLKKRPRRSTAGRRRHRHSSVSLNDSDDDFELSTTVRDDLTQPKPRGTAQKSTRLPLSESEVRDLSISVTVVCTLAGGMDRLPHWPSVVLLFPKLSEDALRRYWQVISTQQREFIDNVTEMLQTTYIEAFVKEEVPSVNFQNLELTDWQTIITWAKSILSRSTSGDQRIQFRSRADLLSTYSLHFKPGIFLHDLANQKLPVSTQKREEVASTHIFGTPLTASPSSSLTDPTTRSNVDLLRARSLILSTILSPSSQLSPSAVSAKLSSLLNNHSESEHLIRSAIDSLQREKLIIRRRDATNSDGIGAYAPSERFYSAFNRGITSTMLNAASAFKLDVLDAAFARGEHVTVYKDTAMEDGEMVCILNLTAGGMVKIKPGADVPSTRYGLDWQRVGYDSDKANRSSFDFSIVLSQTAGYVFGDDVVAMTGRRPKPVPERDGLNEDAKVPVWVDIDGKLQQELWDMMLASVIGTISVRSGVSSKGVSESLGLSLAEWEVELMLTWAEDAGFVSRTASGRGWETGCWWWLCVGRGTVTYDSNALETRKAATEARSTEQENGEASLDEAGGHRRRRLTVKARASKQIETEEAEEEELGPLETGVTEVTGRWFGGGGWQVFETRKPVGSRRTRRIRKIRPVDVVDDAAKEPGDDDDEYHEDGPEEG